MTDFDQDNGPTLNDLTHNRKVKIIAGIAIVAIIAMIVVDTLEFVGKWY